ncbi:MAG: B12-binding domain-containing radical SAM protein [Candidatus Obscuribacterales bacterium]|jgi:radical SAM superfamily enzyme YgiQ (UPF0313 family)|nr:B12-binding domain-containing radical SAM protein [Candidatus Obscuribacterales bacterium]
MKIGMIAMSGVTTYDKQILELGFSLPGFIERGKSIASLPSLALLTLAGMTDSRHQINYIEVADLSQVSELPGIDQDFDLVAISSYSAQILDAYTLADRYRANKIPVVIGGPHASMLPYEAAEHCDAVAIGEGEAIWKKLVSDAESGTLQTYYGSQFSKFDMKNSPMPAFELLQPEKYNRITVQTSRGCPHRCEFCAASILFTQKYKQKPIDKVVAEIDKIKSIWRRPFIEFVDDNGFVDRNYWRALLPHLKKRKVPWFAETDIGIADDPGLLTLMADSHCAQILIGLESPVLAGMDGLELRSNWKYKHWASYKAAIRRIQQHGIRVIGCFIVGLDGHTPETINQLFDFINELELFDVQITVQTAFPGTPLYARLKEEGRLLEPELANVHAVRCELHTDRHDC